MQSSKPTRANRQAAIIAELKKYPEGILRPALIQSVCQATGANEVTVGGDLDRMRHDPKFGISFRKEGRAYCLFLSDRTLTATTDSELPGKSVGATADQIPEKKTRDYEKLEAKYYEPLAKWLRDNKQIRCSKAVVVGSNSMGEKWGTPDVVGRYEVKTEFVRFADEILFCEVKADPSKDAALIGFSQSMIYGKYCHRVYLVLPENTENLDRIKGLCELYGVGLVTIAKKYTKQFHKSFTLVIPAQRREPDPEALNEKMGKLDSDHLSRLGYVV